MRLLFIFIPLILAGCDKFGSFGDKFDRSKQPQINLVCSGFERDFNQDLTGSLNRYYGPKRPVSRTYIFSQTIGFYKSINYSEKNGEVIKTPTETKEWQWQVTDDGTLVMQKQRDLLSTEKRWKEDEAIIRVTETKIEYSKVNVYGNYQEDRDVTIDRYSGDWSVENSDRYFRRTENSSSRGDVIKYTGTEISGKCEKVADKKF